MAKTNPKKRKYGSDRRHLTQQEAPLPWRKMFLFVGLIFITGLLYLLQGVLSPYLGGQIIGDRKTLLHDYDCPVSEPDFKVSVVPDLYSYQPGNVGFNAEEMRRITLDNYGQTAGPTYDLAFDEQAKINLINRYVDSHDPATFARNYYNAIKHHKSPHGGTDFVSKWLVSGNPHVSVQYPWQMGRVVRTKYSNKGYGNEVVACTTIHGQKFSIGFGHLQAITVTEGQVLSAGSLIGTMGDSGSATTTHLHLSVARDLFWDPSYAQLYDTGYLFYFPRSIEDVLTKLVDPVAIIVNPDQAYSIVLDDTARPQIFAHADQYFENSVGTIAAAGSGIVSDVGTGFTAPYFAGFHLSAISDPVSISDFNTVEIMAVDQNNTLFPSASGSVQVVLSSPTAHFQGTPQLQNGKATILVTDNNPGEVVVQVSNHGSLSGEKRLVFTDRLGYLQVTAPQKINVNDRATVVVKPMGTHGSVLTETQEVNVKVFPSVVPRTQMKVTQRGEYLFAPDKEGIYRLTFRIGNVEEEIEIVVQNPEPVEAPPVVVEATPDPAPASTPTSSTPGVSTPSTESVVPIASSPPASSNTDTNTETPRSSSDDGTVNRTLTQHIHNAAAEKAAQEAKNPANIRAARQQRRNQIQLRGGNDYVIHSAVSTYGDRDLLVFNDKDVQSTYPVGMSFTVPQTTHKVSIFNGLNARTFPSSGELKLTKYKPGQRVVNYYPRYVKKDSYKKVVAYAQDGSVLTEKTFIWSPGSKHIFTDVVEGVTDHWQAIKALKEAGVFQGNPDGSFGITQRLNRAATATLIIRSFYSDIDLKTLSVGRLNFPDVSRSAWYASALSFAAAEDFEGESKPAFMKGRPNGKADPDGLVKIEELMTMILRVLEVQYPQTSVWHEGVMSTAVNKGLITAGDRALLDKPLPRGQVAEILYRSLQQSFEVTPQLVQDSSSSSVAADGAGGPEVSSQQGSSLFSNEPAAASNIQTRFRGTQGLVITWESDHTGRFTVYRETDGGNGEILIGTSAGKAFTDTSAKSGKTYFYRIEGEPGSRRGEVRVSL